MGEGVAVSQVVRYNWPLAVAILATSVVAAVALVFLLFFLNAEQQRKVQPFITVVTVVFAFALIGDFVCFLELIAHLIDPSFVDSGT